MDLGLVFRQMHTDFTQVLSDDKHYQTVYFDFSLNCLDLHSKPKLHEKAKTAALVFSRISMSVWIKCSLLPRHVSLLKLVLNLFRTMAW